MEGSSLIEINRTALKDVFYKQLAGKDSKTITFKDFFKFFCTLKVYPDLISSFDLKKILTSILKKKVSEERPAEITYSHFEKIFVAIADHCFPSGESLKLLITHIKNMCYILYHCTLHTKANSIQVNKDTSMTARNSLKILSTTQIKGNSVIQRQSLSKSTSQKLSISGLVTPKVAKTALKKIFEFRSPNLKMLTTRKKNDFGDSDGKIQKISIYFDKFIQRYKTITKENLRKKQCLYEIDKSRESRQKNV